MKTRVSESCLSELGFRNNSPARAEKPLIVGVSPYHEDAGGRDAKAKAAYKDFLTL
jgi:hypothetical protein